MLKAFLVLGWLLTVTFFVLWLVERQHPNSTKQVEVERQQDHGFDWSRYRVSRETVTTMKLTDHSPFTLTDQEAASEQRLLSRQDFKVLMCVPCFVDPAKERSNLGYFQHTLNDWKTALPSLPYTLQIVVFTTVDWEDLIAQYPFVKAVYVDPKIKYDLMWLYYPYSMARLDDYDLFVYTEDDHLFQPRHIPVWIDTWEPLRRTLAIPGYVRIEHDTSM